MTSPPSYQIDYVAVGTGKHIHQSKRQIRFRFGFANIPALLGGATGPEGRGEEHDVQIVWSIGSGKRAIFLDTKLIHHSIHPPPIAPGLLSYDGKFTFTFPMPMGLGNGRRRQHVLQVVAHAFPPLNQNANESLAGQVTSEQGGGGGGGRIRARQFDLLLDGQSFFDMPRIYQLDQSLLVGVGGAINATTTATQTATPRAGGLYLSSPNNGVERIGGGGGWSGGYGSTNHQDDGGGGGDEYDRMAKMEARRILEAERSGRRVGGGGNGGNIGVGNRTTTSTTTRRANASPSSYQPNLMPVSEDSSISAFSGGGGGGTATQQHVTAAPPPYSPAMQQHRRPSSSMSTSGASHHTSGQQSSSHRSMTTDASFANIARPRTHQQPHQHPSPTTSSSSSQKSVLSSRPPTWEEQVQYDQEYAKSEARRILEEDQKRAELDAATNQAAKMEARKILEEDQKRAELDAATNEAAKMEARKILAQERAGAPGGDASVGGGRVGGGSPVPSSSSGGGTTTTPAVHRPNLDRQESTSTTASFANIARPATATPPSSSHPAQTYTSPRGWTSPHYPASASQSPTTGQSSPSHPRASTNNAASTEGGGTTRQGGANQSTIYLSQHQQLHHNNQQRQPPPPPPRSPATPGVSSTTRSVLSSRPPTWEEQQEYDRVYDRELEARMRALKVEAPQQPQTSPDGRNSVHHNGMGRFPDLHMAFNPSPAPTDDMMDFTDVDSVLGGRAYSVNEDMMDGGQTVDLIDLVSYAASSAAAAPPTATTPSTGYMNARMQPPMVQQVRGVGVPHPPSVSPFSVNVTAQNAIQDDEISVLSARPPTWEEQQQYDQDYYSKATGKQRQQQAPFLSSMPSPTTGAPSSVSNQHYPMQHPTQQPIPPPRREYSSVTKDIMEQYHQQSSPKTTFAGQHRQPSVPSPTAAAGGGKYPAPPSPSLGQVYTSPGAEAGGQPTMWQARPSYPHNPVGLATPIAQPWYGNSR